MKSILFALITLLSIHASVGQGLTDSMKDTEEQLRASTKQINQFFRRFNGEEDEDGKRYYPSDKRYRDANLRKRYMPVLFDTKTNQLDNDQTKAFIAKITDKKSPAFLDFNQDDWLAEVSATFKYKGRAISGTLYMRLQQQGQGYEWVIDDVAFSQFKKWFDKDTTETKKFLHPMSHELDFMTLRKGLKDNKHAEQFTPRTFQPDYLTLFIYELNQGNLEFTSVKNVNFHFFAIDGYYFGISNFNRPGYNSGWLISSLVPLANDDQKQQMLDYIYDKN
ncbi:hypothetical protein N7E81_13840 [Reichenbachiella carrageenanivorans]|uniref:Uncharacterized protein n=1 Tax=Reichenbachiella carrageenanivorans TaxID=2979869 RepID=A0ABY6CYH4_9BACT|nr:hypothetical protein [Reichenbachiella carrageenanivorans]UXX78439.1 hypothetical protein N7E81_13840 [Reichenbachiella carrageenanivorans]